MQIPSEKGFFVQFPIYLISSCPELTRDDKWVLLSLMQDHWTEGPFKLSFRSIATISGVPLSQLSSYTDKKGVFHEGAMERIGRVTDYVHCEMGKEIDPTTGKTRGNAQSYITINYTKIWQDNRMYSETKKNRPVSNTNTLFEPVHNEVKPVSYTNEPVPIQNTPVSIANEPVSNSRSETPPYIEKTIQINNITEEESTESPTSSPPDASLSLSSNSYFSSEETIPPPQGDVTVPPPGVEGVSLPTATGGGDAPMSVANDTLNLDTQSFSPDPVGDCTNPTDCPIASRQECVPLEDGEDYTKSRQELQGDSCITITQEETEPEPPDSDAPMEELTEITQEMLLQWMKGCGVSLGLPASCQKAVSVLLPLVRSEQDVEALVKIERKRHPSGVIYIANLAKENVLGEWLPAAMPQESAQTMTQEQADHFAKWLIKQPGFSWETVAIDRYADDTWVTCIRIANDGEESDWYPFACPEHFLDPTPYDEKQIGMAVTYAASLELAVAI